MKHFATPPKAKEHHTSHCDPHAPLPSTQTHTTPPHPLSFAAPGPLLWAMLPANTQRLPHIEGSATLQNDGIYETRGAGETHRTSPPYVNPYTNPVMLTQIYGPISSTQTRDRATDTKYQGAHLPFLRGASGDRGSSQKSNLRRSQPSLLQHFNLSYQTPIAYFTDALCFTEAAEESQRVAIKFEERRWWKQMQKKFRVEVCCAAFGSSASMPLARQGGPYHPSRLAKTPGEILAGFDAALPPKKDTRNARKLAPLPLADQHAPHHASRKPMEHSFGMPITGPDASMITREQLPASLPLFGFHVHLPRLRSEEIHLPLVSATIAKLSPFGAPNAKSRDERKAENKQGYEGSAMIETTPTACSDQQAAPPHSSAPTSNVVPIEGSRVLPSDPDTVASNGMQASQGDASVSGLPDREQEASISSDTLRAAREREAARLVEDAFRHVAGGNVSNSTPLSRQETLETHHIGDVLDSKRGAELSQKTRDADCSDGGHTRAQGLKKSEQHVYFADPKKKPLLGKKEPEGKGSSTFSTTPSPSPYLLCSEEVSANLPAGNKAQPKKKTQK